MNWLTRLFKPKPAVPPLKKSKELRKLEKDEPRTKA